MSRYVALGYSVVGDVTSAVSKLIVIRGDVRGLSKSAGARRDRMRVKRRSSDTAYRDGISSGVAVSGYVI